MKEHINSYVLGIQRHSGRSLVEVMISLTIGLIIVLALTSLFVANRQSYRVTDDKSRLDDEGRLALNLIAHHVRMAGYGTLLSTTEFTVKENSDDGLTAINETEPALFTMTSNGKGKSSTAIFGCAGAFSNSAQEHTEDLPIGCTAGANADALLVRYEVDEASANLTAANEPADCLGAAIIKTPAALAVGKRPATPEHWVIDNRFFVRNNNGVPELYCQGNGNTPPGAALINPPQPIAENVEQMRITYGVSSTGGQVVDRYLTADAVSALTPNVAANWTNVISARICLVVRSTNDRVTLEKQSYRDCNNNVVVATDNRLRGVFSTTVTIRSRSTGAT